MINTFEGLLQKIDKLITTLTLPSVWRPNLPVGPQYKEHDSLSLNKLAVSLRCPSYISKTLVHKTSMAEIFKFYCITLNVTVMTEK